MPNSTNRRLVPMVIGLHVMLAVAAGLLPVLLPVSEYLDDVPAAIIALSQMSLLSLWIGFGHGNLLLRLGLVFVAGICLTSMILCADAGGWPSFTGIGWFVVGIITCAPVPCVAIPAWITRIRWAEVHREMLGDLPVTSDRLQFSLTHVLQWTAILSILLAVCRFLAGISDDFGPSIIVFAMLLGFICGSVSLASLWASLARGQPLVRVVIVVTLAAALGLIAGYAVGGKENTLAWLFLSVISTAMAAFVNVSLLFIRAAGFRAVSRERNCGEA
jgi:hypothetical protein